ncbi:hypothetical protein MOMA_08686 [Moraxella macacae 0408225]|uniref:Uncharacterized protein n=1 Tax=Moraxella macacae 0408225 TaxID=1230338 RepID=L2F842_9GAMM|nr:hypothetical protein [Moraxella macacae]ELA08623.1 hypothetical protein MOMA_08686 [Moraxella macacae 0408225]
MAIKLPGLKNNLTKRAKSTQAPPQSQEPPNQELELQDLLKEIPKLPTELLNSTAQTASVDKKPVNKKAILAGAVGVLFIGVLVLFVLPKVMQTDTHADMQAETHTETNTETPVESAPEITTTAEAAPASAPTENLRTEEFVITGDELNGKLNDEAGHEVGDQAADNQAVHAQVNHESGEHDASVVSEIATGDEPTQVFLQLDEPPKPEPVQTVQAEPPKGAMSYDEFVRTSEKYVFADR